MKLATNLISIFLAAAPLTIVPLARGLFDTHVFASQRGVARLLADRRISLGAAALLAVAVALPPGAASALLAVPWAFFVLALATDAFLRTRSDRAGVTTAIGARAAHVFLAVGGGWAFASCAGWTPFGFEEPIVRLTAVHFHYAGFALPAVAVHVAATNRTRLATKTMLGVVLGVPLVAIGIVLRTTAVELVATSVLAAVAIALVTLQLQAAIRLTSTPAMRRAASLLTISAVSLATSMTLAVVYAAGRHRGEPILDIPQMAATHGLLNAVGFALCGLIGWRMASACVSPVRRRGDSPVVSPGHEA
jgi:hypothetical protein